MNDTPASVRVLAPGVAPGATERLESAPPPAVPLAEPRTATRGWLARSWPTLLVLVVLAVLGVCGHYSGWTIPKFDALFGNGEAAKDDWCKEHGVPESICVECNQSLMPRLESTWCKVHGVHYCLFENPELAQLPSVPAIVPADLERAQRALTLKDRPKNNDECKLPQRRIQLASQKVVEKLDIRTTEVQRISEIKRWGKPSIIEEAITANGEITFEQPRVASVSVPISGRIWTITEKGKLGASVKEGDMLAVVEAREVGMAKAEFQSVVVQVELKGANVDTLRPFVGTTVSNAEFRKAEAELHEAQIRLVGAEQALINLGLPIRTENVKKLPPDELGKHLQFLGLPNELVKTLDARKTTANLIAVRATREGVVTAVNVAHRDLVDSTKTLFVVVDNRQMWVTLNIRLEDKRYLHVRDPKSDKPGQTVRFLPDGSDKEVAGELVWISASVDDTTRRFQVRASLPNPDRELTANTFGTGTIVLRQEHDAIVVPNEAVHWEGDCFVVFVRDKNFYTPGGLKVFHVRTVRLGVRNAEFTEIVAGVSPGESIATKNSATLRSELLKNNLGLG